MRREGVQNEGFSLYERKNRVFLIELQRFLSRFRTTHDFLANVFSHVISSRFYSKLMDFKDFYTRGKEGF